MAKAGLRGVDILNVTVMALIFGSKASTGIMLPLLCVADILAVTYYNRHAEWVHFKRKMPWIIAGVLLGWWIGKDLNEAVFKKIMASIILLATLAMIWNEYKKSERVSGNKLLAPVLGLTVGFTTMLGNLAGAFSNIYFLLLKFPKNKFIGTVSWMFLFVNLFKLPFHIFSWKTIQIETIKYDLLLLPTLFLGFWLGVKVVSQINNDLYRKIIIWLTVLGAVLMFFR